MVDEIYNPSTDNFESVEAPRLNPATGISNFARVETKTKNPLKRLVQRQKVQQVKSDTQKALAQMQAEAKYSAKYEKAVSKFKPIASSKKIKLLGLAGYTPKKFKIKPAADRLKVMRLSNLLEKKRLINQIQKLKLQRQIENLRKRGKITQIAMQPVPIRTLAYPAYATPEIMGDIDSMYADIGHGDGNIFGSEDIFGGEKYFDENFYPEDFWGNEFDTDPFTQLNMKPRTGVSPLLW